MTAFVRVLTAVVARTKPENDPASYHLPQQIDSDLAYPARTANMTEKNPHRHLIATVVASESCLRLIEQ
jgi:hypothetical protein